MIYSITEGQQAEEYKKRKQLEDHKKFMKEYDRIQNRSNAGAKGEPDEDGDVLFRSNKDNERDSKTKEIVDKELNRRQYSKGQQDKNTLNLAYHRNEARDALNRHIRRHPDQYKESVGIFDSIRFM